MHLILEVWRYINFVIVILSVIIMMRFWFYHKMMTKFSFGLWNVFLPQFYTWRVHDMKVFSTSPLALCEGNPLVTGVWPSQRTNNVELWCLFYFFIGLNKLLNKQLSYQWSKLPWSPGDIAVLLNFISVWSISKWEILSCFLQIFGMLQYEC